MKDWEELSRKMALEDLDGRQIRDIVRIAQASAFGDESPITMRHLQDAIDAMRTFEREFEKGRDLLEGPDEPPGLCEKTGEPRGRKRPRHELVSH